MTLYRAGVGALGTATANGSGDWSYNYSGTTLPNGTYAFTATATLNSITTPATAPYLVTVETTAPTVTLLAPTSTYSEDAQVTVLVSDPNGIPDGTTVYLDVDLDDGTDFSGSGESGYTTATTVGGLATFDIAPALTVGSTVRLRRADNLAGVQGTSSMQSLTINSVGSPWTLTGDLRTASVMDGEPLLQLGTLDVEHDLDLDQSPGTSMSQDPSLSYSSDRVSDEPIIQATLQADNAVALPSTVSVQLTWNGTAQTSVNYNTTGLHPGDLIEVAAQVDSAVSTTGRYAWTLQVTMNYGTPIVESVTGTAFVVAEDSSPYGAGWTLGAVDQLVSIAASGSNPAGLLPSTAAAATPSTPTTAPAPTPAPPTITAP